MDTHARFIRRAKLFMSCSILATLGGATEPTHEVSFGPFRLDAVQGRLCGGAADGAAAAGLGSARSAGVSAAAHRRGQLQGWGFCDRRLLDSWP